MRARAHTGLLLVLVAGLVCSSAPVALADSSGPAVVRDARWYLHEELTGGAAERSFGYGRAEDVPVMGDWDGDGTTTPGVFRDGTWHLREANAAGPADTTVALGPADGLPVVGDWDGDGDDDVGIVHGGRWRLDTDHDGRPEHEFSYGRPGDDPLVGDWDGDGVSTPAVRRGRTYHLRGQNAAGVADRTFVYGLASDRPVVGPWTGADDRIGVVRGDRWLLRHELASGAADVAFRYGRPSDLPLPWRRRAAARVTYTYWLGTDGEPRGDLDRVAAVTRSTLEDDRGWSLDGSIAFVAVRQHDRADVRVWLTEADRVGEKAPACSDTYSCTVGDDVYLNDDNWQDATPSWDHRPIDDYRPYLVNHELGHWLGLDHHNDSDRCAEDGAAPVMMQQSIDTFGCETNVWPLPFERDRVRDLHVP